MTPPSLGIDISKETFDVEISLASKPKHKRFLNQITGFKSLSDWLTKYGVEQVHACLEATGNYGEAVALYLRDRGHFVSIVNPAQIAYFAKSELQRNKDDRVDAGVIRRFCEQRMPPEWKPLTADERELQGLTRHLENLKVSKQQEENRLQSGVSSETVSDSIQEMITFLGGKIEQIEKKIQEHIDHHPELKQKQSLLISIPGIGKLTAAMMLGEMPQLDELGSARKAAAQCGITPAHRRSGKSVRGKPRLSKIGNARMRKILYMPALAAMRFNPVVREFCRRLLENDKHKSKLAIVGAAMRKLLHIAFGVLKHRQMFNSNHQPKFAC
jgi:transposase